MLDIPKSIGFHLKSFVKHYIFPLDFLLSNITFSCYFSSLELPMATSSEVNEYRETKVG